VEVNLRGAAVSTPFVTNIDYDAKGQRTLIDYGNGVRTTYEYDPLTFRLAQLKTLRSAERLQDLFYTYDPSGNITSIRDDAQQTIYFNGQVVEPHCDYAYDALYRLIDAKGREHIGQLGRPETTWNDEFRVNLQHPHDSQAMRNYSEQYVYDAVGNFEKLIHRAANGNWTRAYTYTEPSLIEPDKKNNRLSSTIVHPNGNQPIVEPYTYDAHGNMTSMPHLLKMEWDFEDQLHATSKQVVNNGGTQETSYYVYDAARQRVRKVTELATGQVKDERIYLGGYEIYRRHGANPLVRETLHIMADQQRIALVETRTQGNEPGVPEQLVRYQFGNHIGSASLELDGEAQVFSYEEYFPYGSTSYQAVRSQTETPKRYRYIGMERDEETGFAYHDARYYVPFIGRWVSCDPAGLKDGVNAYSYASSTPINLIDPGGMESKLPKQIEDLLNTAQSGYSQYVEHFRKKGITNASELGTAAAAALQNDFEKVFGAKGVRVTEQSYTFEGEVAGKKVPWSEHRIDIELKEYNLGLELKLNPGSKRPAQSRVFLEKTIRESKITGYIDSQQWEAIDFSKEPLSERQLKKLGKQVTKLEKEISSGVRAVARAKNVRKYVGELTKSLGKVLKGIGTVAKKGARTVARPLDIALNVKEFAADPSVETGTSILGSAVGATAGAKIGAAIGTPLGPVGIAVGGIIGGIAGGIAGSDLGRAFGKGVKFFLKTAEESPGSFLAPGIGSFSSKPFGSLHRFPGQK
jgi:RHS repeat-associated protein